MCVCGQPGSGDVLQCTSCAEQFHRTCLRLSTDAFLEVREAFCCTACRASGAQSSLPTLVLGDKPVPCTLMPGTIKVEGRSGRVRKRGTNAYVLVVQHSEGEAGCVGELYKVEE